MALRGAGFPQHRAGQSERGSSATTAAPAGPERAGWGGRRLLCAELCSPSGKVRRCSRAPATLALSPRCRAPAGPCPFTAAGAAPLRGGAPFRSAPRRAASGSRERCCVTSLRGAGGAALPPWPTWRICSAATRTRSPSTKVCSVSLSLPPSVRPGCPRRSQRRPPRLASAPAPEGGRERGDRRGAAGRGLGTCRRGCSAAAEFWKPWNTWFKSLTFSKFLSAFL